MRFQKNVINNWKESFNKQSKLNQLIIRSNLLGSDLKVTNFGGGNTSSKISLKDPITKKMENALLARYARLLDIAQSPHGSEIYNERNRLCGALAQDSVRDLRALLAKALKAADQVGEIELKPSGLSPAAAAEILQMAAAGLKAEAPDLKTYTKRLQGLVGLFFDGLARS